VERHARGEAHVKRQGAQGKLVWALAQLFPSENGFPYSGGIHGVGFEPTRISPADLKPATLTTRSSMFNLLWMPAFKSFQLSILNL